MNMIYNSEQYSVVEFGVDHNLEALRFGGYEIVDKSGRREAFIGGKLAQSFRRRQQSDCQRTDDGRNRRVPWLLRFSDEPAGSAALGTKPAPGKLPRRRFPDGILAACANFSE